tara:strand:- start:2568 stop:3245 length:678 start_codon:yes stop_codon:yes gene_type:complete
MSTDEKSRVHKLANVSSTSKVGGVVTYGFQRDQPAVWHILSQTWAAENGVPYLGQGCKAWHQACNPQENPIECWHWCHWDPLQRMVMKKGHWKGLETVNRLSHVQLLPRSGAAFEIRNSAPAHKVLLPPLHRMCLRSCFSVLARLGMGTCSLLTRGATFCWPADVDKMSLCDGTGCLAQMTSLGGGWIKHTGHQHWRDILPSCVPTSGAEAVTEQADHKALCAHS